MLRTASKLQIHKHQRNFRARTFRQKEESATKLQVFAERIVEDAISGDPESEEARGPSLSGSESP